MACTFVTCTGFLTRLSNQLLRIDESPRRHQADANLAAVQSLGTELVVRQRQDRADAELAIQLVQRRRAEADADAAPRATRGR